MEKQKYEAPEMEIVYFETEDVLTVSGDDGDFVGVIPTMPWEEWP